MTSHSSVSGSARVTGDLAAVFGAAVMYADIDTTVIDDNVTAHPAEHAETSGVVAAAVASIESSAAAADTAVDEGANSDDLQERVDVQTEHESKEAADASAHASASVGTAGRQLTFMSLLGLTGWRLKELRPAG